jgi:MerR family transcriptional regulator, copper efflux regulator
MMTIGKLSRRTGVSVKVLRRYDSQGLLYSAGRSPANYRRFDESALWCVEVVTGLRQLGLTVAEIRDLARIYQDEPQEPIGPRLAERLALARTRIDEKLAELAALRHRIDDFEARHRAELGGQGDADFRAGDPTASALDSPPGGTAYLQSRR